MYAFVNLCERATTQSALSLKCREPSTFAQNPSSNPKSTVSITNNTHTHKSCGINDENPSTTLLNQLAGWRCCAVDVIAFKHRTAKRTVSKSTTFFFEFQPTLCRRRSNARELCAKIHSGVYCYANASLRHRMFPISEDVL